MSTLIIDNYYFHRLGTKSGRRGKTERRLPLEARVAAADLAAAAGEEMDASSAESPDTSRENVRREEGEAAAVGEDN